MKKVLWLASWYPNEREPFSGDFIQRHAEAVSICLPVKVIYVGKQADHSLGQLSGKVEYKSGNLQEHIEYYSNRKRYLKKWRSLFSYIKIHSEIIKDLKKNDDLPELVHVHVAMKAGLIALYLKWKYKIPYVLTEHWSGYYPQSKDSLYNKSVIERYLTKLVIRNASELLPVSHALGIQISQNWAQIPFRKISNVVNTRFFHPAENKKPHPFRFIHISSLLYPKNPEGIINCFIHLLKSGHEAELILVGPLNTSVNQLLSIHKTESEKLRTTGEISYEDVGKELRNADALILFSYYENMPCVILEALCSGLPVIASQVGGIPEVINPENGILVAAGNEQMLLEAMQNMMANYGSFERGVNNQMASATYSYEKIGKEIVQVYEEILAVK
jgi:glycosyltransferase involved in cell wall biosynthesis